MGETFDVSGAEEEATAKLKRICADLVLAVAGGLGAFAAFRIVAAEDVQKIGGTQIGNSVGLALFVDQERKGDTSFVSESASVILVAEANDGEGCAFVAKDFLVVAQLRDVFAAEDSAIVAKENDHSGFAVPERTETNLVVVGVGQNDVCELLAERFFHAKTTWSRK